MRSGVTVHHGRRNHKAKGRRLLSLLRVGWTAELCF